MATTSYEAYLNVPGDKKGGVFTHTAEIRLIMSSPSRPAKTYGLPEDCYPAVDAEFEIQEVLLWETKPNSPQWIELTPVQFGWLFPGANGLMEKALEWADDNEGEFEW